MARYRGPRNRLSRREGVDLGLQSIGSHGHAQMLKRLTVPPGQHGPKGKRKISGYGIQLREKQKVKRMYGVLERQFRKVFAHAKKSVGNTGEMFLVSLERRLDNVFYRMGLSPTRSCARQLVSHGHAIVNGKKMTIPSYEVKVDDVVSLKPSSLEIPVVKKTMEDKGVQIPEWIERKGPVGKIIRLPKREDISEDINEQQIVEFYSR